MNEDTIKTELIDITPDISLYPKIGKSGYTLTQSIAELVDNSIDARIPKLLLDIKVIIQDNYIIVEDNGVGMDRQTSEKALKLGYSEKINSLGEFGLGLKSACTSIGSKFTVRTYPNGKNEGYEFVYDEKTWLSKPDKSWTDKLKVFSKEMTKHGTSIKIEKPKRKINKQRKRDVLTDFSKRFSPFILNNEIKITVNGDGCVPETIQLDSDGKKEFEIGTNSGTKLYGWYGLMKRGSDKGQYGFTTFRRGRMITCYDKIGIFHHPTVSRIVGEIHMDNIPVSHSKKEFENESDEYKEAEALLTSEFREIVKKARQISLASKVTQDIKNQTEAWKGAIVESFHRELKDLVDEPTIKKKSFDKNDPLGELVIEKRDPKLKDAITKAIEKNERTRSPKDKRQIITNHFITIMGKKYQVNHEFSQQGEDSAWKQWVYSKERGSIDVFTNEDFPAYALTKDESFYAAIHIAESIAEIIGEINNFDVKRVNETKETLMRKASEILDQFREQQKEVS